MLLRFLEAIMSTEIIKFTRSTLTAIPTPVKRKYYKDQDTRGLLLVALTSGNKAFEIYRKVRGSPIRIGLGHFDPALPESKTFPVGTDLLSLVGNSPALNVNMARILAGAVNSQLDIGTNPSQVQRATRKAKQSELTLQDAFNLYEKEYLIPKDKRTTSDLRSLFERNLGYVIPGQKKPHGKERTKSPYGVDWSKNKLSTITSSDVLKLHNRLKEGGGAYTANRTFQLLRAIFNKMILWKMFDGVNPCDGIELFDEQERERYIQEEELPLFFTALEKVQDDNFKDFIGLLLFTGARRENVLGIRWGDIDFGAGLWTIPGNFTKNGSLLTVPLTTPAIQILHLRKSNLGNLSEFVFPARSKSGYMTTPKKQWAALLKSAGIENLRLHDLRRTLGSWTANTGASLQIIGKALGHKSIQTTAIYARLNGGVVKTATEIAVATILSKAGVSMKTESIGSQSKNDS